MVSSDNPTGKPRDVDSVRPAATSDAATADDQLGLEPYARAIAEFLLNRDTKGPITLAVEGEWGSGKSSFMLLLERKLREGHEIKAAGDIPHNQPVCVQFNPWRHDKSEAVWAAFAVTLTRQIIAAQKSWLKRWRSHISLLFQRYDWKHGWPEVLKAAAMFLLISAVAAALVALTYRNGAGFVVQFAKTVTVEPSKKQETAKEPAKPAAGEDAAKNDPAAALKWLQGFGFWGVLLGYSTVVAAGMGRIRSYFKSPLEIDLARYLRSPEYRSRVAFIEEFHEDLTRVLRAYAGGATIVVFIDDLDRCEAPRAAELMQAINLMVSTDFRDIVFIIGMDREKIAAGLAFKYKEILPFLYHREAAEDGKLPPSAGIRFGFDYLEKFIQLSFQLPVPGGTALEGFVESLSGRPDEGGPVERTGVPGPQTESFAGGWAPPATAGSEFQIEFSSDSVRVQQIVLAMAPVLGRNPRRLKQFVNLFRLRAYILYETGVLFHGITPEQLGILVAMQIRFPLLAAQAAGDPKWLSEEEKRSGDDRFPMDKAWRGLVANLHEADLISYFTVCPALRIVDPGTSSPLRVLWIDDHPEIVAGLVRRIRSKLHVSIDQCTSSKQAIARLRISAYHLVISDLERGTDRFAGLTLLRRLKDGGLNASCFLFTTRERASDPTLQEQVNDAGLTLTSDDDRLFGFVEGAAREWQFRQEYDRKAASLPS